MSTHKRDTSNPYREGEAVLKFSNLTRKQEENLRLAVEYLRRAGVTFDTGVNVETGTHDWQLDWSLKGATVKTREATR